MESEKNEKEDNVSDQSLEQEDVRLAAILARKKLIEKIESGDGHSKVQGSFTQKVLDAIKNFYRHADKPYADEILHAAFEAHPIKTFDLFSGYARHPAAKEIAEKMVVVNPFLVLKKQELQEPAMQSIREKAEKLVQHINGLKEKMGFESRFRKLEQFLQEANPSIPTALSQFNDRHACSLRCVGIREYFTKTERVFEYNPIECVFINTFENKNALPIRIGIPYHRLLAAKGAEAVDSVLEQEFSRQLGDETIVEKGNTPLKRQYELWDRSDKFDLPMNKTTVFGITLEEGGPEVSLADLLINVYKKRYKANIDKIIMSPNPALWEYYLKQAGIDPSVLPTLKQSDSVKNLFPPLEKSLEHAVDNKHEMFVFSYLMHGGEVQGGNILTTTGLENADKIAESIAKNYKGKPLCSQIDILIVAESCYSGLQLNGMIEYLKKNKIPVKNLRIVSAANTTTAAMRNDNPSVINEQTMPSSKKKFPPMSYHMSYYFQLMEFLESKGHKLAPGAGSFGHALRFADRMAREDSTTADIGGSMYEQDMQYFHYSTEHEIDQLLSRADIYEGSNKQRIKWHRGDLNPSV